MHKKHLWMSKGVPPQQWFEHSNPGAGVTQKIAMSGNAPPGKTPETDGKTTKPKTGLRSMAPGCVNCIISVKTQNSIDYLSRNRDANIGLKFSSWYAHQSLAQRECVAITSRTTNTWRKTSSMKLKTLNLVKDVVPSVLNFSEYSYTSTDCSASTTTRADNKACTGMYRNLGQLQCCIQYLNY